MSSGVSKGNPVKGGSKTKPSKTDSKTDKADLNPKIQPTAEQMQIARIMDSHRSEDPELQKKIRQVMEVTKVSEDEASMALHSRDYDITQAITLLTEEGGELLQSEWEQAGKKKKSKAPAAKNEVLVKERGAKDGRERSEKRDGRNEKPERERKETEISDGQAVGSEQRRSDRGDRGERGRGGRGRGGRGGRGGARVDNKENDESGSRTFGGNFVGRIANGPGRGGRGGGRGSRGREASTRTFASRTRVGGRDDDGYNTIDVWENSQAEAPKDATPLKVDKWDEFPSAEDWDNEEYTGSLQETKVFTPSAQTSQIAPPLGDTTNGVGPNHLGNSVAPAVGADVKISSVGGGDALKDPAAVPGLNSVPAGPTPVVPGQSIDLSLLLQKSQNSSNSTVSNAGANLLASLQSSYSNASQVPLGSTNQALPPRNKMQRPRGPTTTTKIPSSAVEMPVDSVGTLDVQFGGLDFEDNSSMNFNSVLSSNKTSADILYGAPPGKLDTFVASAADKDGLSNKAAPPTAPSPFQNQRSAPTNLVETGPSQTGGVPISPNIDSLALQNQKSGNSGQSSYGNASNVGSAFAPYGKGAPGFPAPGFPPVTQAPAGSVTYSNSTVGNGNSPGAANVASYTSVAAAQSSYHSIGNLPYGSQAVNASEVQSSQIQGQPILASASQSQYPNNTSQPVPVYHHGVNSSNPAYGNAAAPNSQYGNYGQKLQGSLTAQNVTSGHQTVKDSQSETNSSVPASGSSSANSVQMGSLQQGSTIASTSNSNPKISSASNVASAGGAKMGIPPGMVMQPQYIFNHQGGYPAVYSVPPLYGFDENSVQLLPRMPPHIQGYYDAGAANYGNPISFALEAANAGGPGAGRSDGSMNSYSGGSDARFPRSDSSTASPVPSNIAGQNTQQPMYNPTLPYYFVGNNMMHPGTHFPYPPPHAMYPTSAMATPTNASGAPHAATGNHQYQNKGVFPPYSYEGPPGPSTDFSKNSYASGPGVGPNSSSGKTASATSSGTSQSTDLNSSMYGKGHLNKIPSYEKQPFVNSGGGYNSMGAGTNPLNSQLTGAGIGAPYGVYIAQQPVTALQMPQDGSNASRQGSGQPKGNKQQYGQPPYWPN